jgi:hypothetical protein
VVITQENHEEPHGLKARTVSHDELRREFGMAPAEPPRVPPHNEIDAERTKPPTRRP